MGKYNYKYVRGNIGILLVVGDHIQKWTTLMCKQTTVKYIPDDWLEQCKDKSAHHRVGVGIQIQYVFMKYENTQDSELQSAS